MPKKPETVYVCRSCRTEFAGLDDFKTLDRVKNIHLRILPGEVAPWGECPKCGAFVRQEEKPRKPEPRLCRNCAKESGETFFAHCARCRPLMLPSEEPEHHPRACWNCGKEMHENLGVYCYDCAPLLLPPEDGRPFREVPEPRPEPETVFVCQNCGEEADWYVKYESAWPPSPWFCSKCAPLVATHGSPFQEAATGDEAHALDQIHALLDGEEWGSQTLEAVAQIIEATGRKIRDPNEEDSPDA